MRTPTVLLAAVFLCGCPSISLLGSARTLDKGKTQFAAGLSSSGSVFTRTPMNGQPFNIAPQPELAVRHGVSDRVELGGRLWGTGLQADAKVALLRGPGDVGFDVSVAPSLGVIWAPGENVVPSIPVQAAVLGGYRFGAGEVTLGLRLFDQIVFYEGAVNQFWGGANLGVALKLTDTVRLMPEVAVLVPFRTVVNEVAFQGGLGVLFGG